MRLYTALRIARRAEMNLLQLVQCFAANGSLRLHSRTEAALCLRSHMLAHAPLAELCRARPGGAHRDPVPVMATGQASGSAISGTLSFDCVAAASYRERVIRYQPPSPSRGPRARTSALLTDLSALHASHLSGMPAAASATLFALARSRLAESRMGTIC